ncbi:hypothetical protein ACB092_M013200 [Castanea dentata]
MRAMRRGVHAGMPLGTLPCPMPASLGKITSFSKKPSFFWKSLQICGQAAAKAKAAPMGVLPRPRHAAKAKAAPMGALPRLRHAQATQPRPRQPPWACCQGQGMQPGPRQPRPRRAAKAKAWPRQAWACCHGQGMQPGPRQPRPRHAAKAKAAPMGRQPRPRHAAKAKAAPMGVLPRPRHAQATQPRPRQPPWAGCQGQVMHKPRSQGQGSPHGHAAKAKRHAAKAPWACCQGQGSPHGQAAKAKSCTSHAAKAKAAPMGMLPRPSHAQGMQPGRRQPRPSHAQATQPRPRQPPWACCQGQVMHKACSQAVGSQGQGSPHGHAAKAPCACNSQGQGSPHVHATAKAKAAPTGRQPRPRAPHGDAAEGTGGLNLRTERGKEF